jgi:hypothetical protein
MVGPHAARREAVMSPVRSVRYLIILLRRLRKEVLVPLRPFGYEVDALSALVKDDDYISAVDLTLNLPYLRFERDINGAILGTLAGHELLDNPEESL